MSTVKKPTRQRSPESLAKDERLIDLDPGSMLGILCVKPCRRCGYDRTLDFESCQFCHTNPRVIITLKVPEEKQCSAE